MSESPLPGNEPAPPRYTSTHQWPGYENPVSPVNSAVQPYAPAAHQTEYAYPPATGMPIVSAGGRLGAFLLDGVLIVVTLWIGWFAWSMVTWAEGQSPGKKLLGYVVVDASTGQRFDWGRMAMRDFVIKGLLGTVLSACTFGIYFWVDALMVLGDGQRTLHDRMAGSIVVRQH
ncbi:RDD family protein [Actinoplanes sp. CA-015351]|uniref:RDD family protein n=1 Tax=Actinoplanes sp. CA-015351 TaxID=3239897 RepID=UPI003D9665CF